MSVALFKCIEVTQEIANHILPTKRVLSVKGFASRLDPKLPVEKELEQFAAGYDILAFDGDELREDSFTKYIAALVHSRFGFDTGIEDSSAVAKNKIALHAVKFASEVQDLIDSWDNTMVNFEYDKTQNHLNMITYKNTDECLHEDENLSIVEIDLYYRAVSGLPHTEDEGQRYVDLGVHHLTLVNPSAVVVLGGGKILVDEFKAEIDKEGNGDMNRKWHLFNPTTRRKNVGPGSRVEDVEEEIEICGLVAIDHPQLIKHV